MIRGTILTVMLVALTVLAHRGGSSGVAASQSAGSCLSQDSSRWISSGLRGVPADTFGNRDDTWLGSISGIDATGDTVVVFDQGAATAWVLSDRLEPIVRVGRQGGGPGEFTPLFRSWLPRYWDFNYIGAASGVFGVLDVTEVEIFRLDGRHQEVVRLPGIVPPLAPFGLRYLKPLSSGGFSYVYDSVDVRGNKPRRLQLWHAAHGERTLVHEVRLPPPPRPDRLGPRDPRALWAQRGSCHAFLYGSGDSVFLFNATSGSTSAIALPALTVPQLGSHPDDGTLRIPGAPTRKASSNFGEAIKWTDLAIDPDGFLWVRAWTPMADKLAHIFVIDMQGNSLTDFRGIAFPKAFGSPGTFFSIVSDPETEEQLIVRVTAKESTEQL